MDSGPSDLLSRKSLFKMITVFSCQDSRGSFDMVVVSSKLSRQPLDKAISCQGNLLPRQSPAKAISCQRAFPVKAISCQGADSCPCVRMSEAGAQLMARSASPGPPWSGHQLLPPPRSHNLPSRSRG